MEFVAWDPKFTTYLVATRGSNCPSMNQFVFIHNSKGLHIDRDAFWKIWCLLLSRLAWTILSQCHHKFENADSRPEKTHTWTRARSQPSDNIVATGIKTADPFRMNWLHLAPLLQECGSPTPFPASIRCQDAHVSSRQKSPRTCVHFSSSQELQTFTILDVEIPRPSLVAPNAANSQQRRLVQTCFGAPWWQYSQLFARWGQSWKGPHSAEGTNPLI